MAIRDSERAKMRQARSVGPRMIDYLERIGIERLADLKGREPAELAFAINMELGRNHINSLGAAALANLVALAESEG